MVHRCGGSLGAFRRAHLREFAVASVLFTEGDAPDPGYRNIRDGTDPRLKLAKWHCEYLWTFFQWHADNEFRKELSRTFDARYWEMYLTTSLILAGYTVTCPKPGPDVGIIYKGQRIWFEAVSPDCGDPSKSDSITEPLHGPVPEEKIILRYLNSISTKYKDQYLKWRAKDTISVNDAVVYAINPWEIRFDHADGDPPRILQAGYTVGPPYIEVDRATPKAVRSGYHFRNTILKAPKKDAATGQEKRAEIPTGVFQQHEYAWLSALLCSRLDALNHPAEMGDNFQLAPNPHADVPMPPTFRLRGVYYDTKSVDGGYQVTPTPFSRATLF
jgi:hypothetical protein